ncbi:MAG TPA: tetratricopeptide repeat protein, partial [Ktedonobacteraceae bacterium]|nr:tetratricopeptide repeat protein [Ktedonobacteraceae bacterium]
MLAQFIKALHELDSDLTEEDIADILWLSLHMRSSSVQPDRAPQDDAKDRSRNQNPRGNRPPPDEPKPPPKDEPPADTTGQKDSRGSNLHTPAARGTDQGQARAGALPLRGPGITPLPGSLQLGRALRPLMRRIPSRTQFVLDEAKSAQRIAEQLLVGQHIAPPVLQPVSTRWLEVALVIDESSSMSIWRPAVHEFKRLLERHGAFRDVRSWGIQQDQQGRISLHNGWPGNAKSRERNPYELIDPGGRRLILLISDCISEMWYNPDFIAVVENWGRRGPLALLEMLPQRLWSRSALGDAVEIQVHAQAPGLPNNRLNYEPASYLVEKKELKGRVPIPIVSLHTSALQQWVQAALMAGPAWSAGYILTTREAEPGSQTTTMLSAKERIQQFSAGASPLARHLLRLLAAAPISLPTIRLIQHTMLPGSDLGHVAEILFSGLLEQLPAAQEEYDFIDGVRDLLIEMTPKSESLKVLNAVSQFIERETGHTLTINVLLENPEAVHTLVIDQRSRPFAAISTHILRRFGGKYRQLAEYLEEHVEAQRYGASVGSKAETLQQHLANKIGHTIIITPIHGEQLKGIVHSVGPTFVTVKQSLIYRSIVFDMIASWEVPDDEHIDQAINVAIPDIHEMFKDANNYADDGDYKKAIDQIEKVLALDVAYPQAQELLEKWREYARAISVPRGTTPYPRAKRKQLIERDLEGAIPLFYEAIQQNDAAESAIKDLASLLIQLDRPEDAITVLQQYRHLANDQQRINNLLIGAYQQARQYEQAIDLLKQMLERTTAADRKARFSWRIGGFYVEQKDYANAEYWFREVIALGLVNKSAQRNLAFCFIQLQRYDEAEQILTATLPDQQSAELLQAITVARATGASASIPDLTDDIIDDKISSFARFFLDRCSYEGVPHDRVQQKNFEQADVLRLEELAMRVGTRRPRERAEYYLSAAKIALELDEWDEYTQIYRYLCRSFASRGDAAIITSKPLDTAREWYCEALCVYDGDHGRTRDEQDAIIALICFLFATFGRNNVPTSVEERKNIRIDDSLRQMLQHYGQPEKAFDAITYLIARSQFAANRILTRLYASQELMRMALDYVERRGIPVRLAPTSLPQFSELWKPLRLKEIEKANMISTELRAVASIEMRENSIKESLDRLQVIEPDLFFDLDKNRITMLGKILENMHDLVHQSTFETMEYFCNRIDNMCKELLREIEANPTRISVEELYPIVKAIEEKTLKYLEGIYLASVPQLTLRLADRFESYYTLDANDLRIEIQIVIGNKPGCSPAEAVRLIVLQKQEKIDMFIVEEPEIKLDGLLHGGGQGILLVPIRLTEHAIQSQAFSVSMYAQYRTGLDNTLQTEVFSFSINLEPAEKFEYIKNPYAPGMIVGNEAMFYGRDELITNIAEAIHAARTTSTTIVIFGQKRVGKSSLLYHLGKRFL